MNTIRWVAVCAVGWALVIAATCSGCALPPVQYLPDEKRALDAAQAGLEAVGLGPCAKLDAVAVAYAWAPCGVRDTADCVQMRGARQTIVVREGQPLIDSQCGPVCHGALHVCAGGDPGHTNPKVWIQAGGRESAQGRAAALLGRQP